MNIRKNVYELPASDMTLHWYSKAVEVMKQRSINDPTSWWYWGAVHGYVITSSTKQFWEVATDYPPKQSTIDSGFWNNCQHGTWFFLPWHRMYLYYFEATVAKAVVEAGGPSGWTLPFWNYCEAFKPGISVAEQQKVMSIPPAFGDSQGKNSDYPGLWLEGRVNYVLQKRYVNPWPALDETVFTNTSEDVNFGGGITGFAVSGGKKGQLEQLPHDVVHGYINGAMGNTKTAALDPIFWLHHANIDRMWQVWIESAGHSNPASSDWLNFEFDFHDENGEVQTVKVKDVRTTEQLNYTYSPSFPEMDTASPNPPGRAAENVMDVVGASNINNELSHDVSDLALNMVPQGRRKSRISVAARATNTQAKTPKRVLHVNNVTGTGSPCPIDIFISGDGKTALDDEHFVGSLGLFGLEDASTPSLDHDGSGLSFAFDVTQVIERLSKQQGWSEDKISFQFKPQLPRQGEKVKVGRVSLHSELH